MKKNKKNTEILAIQNKITIKYLKVKSLFQFLKLLENKGILKESW